MAPPLWSLCAAAATALALLLSRAAALEVDCFPELSKITCRCFGFDRDTIGQENLNDIVQRSVSGYYTNIYMSHVEMLDCGNLDIVVNLRAFLVDGQPQNISIVSFENVDDLQLEVQNVDFGDKQFVFKAVKYLTLTGELENPSTRVNIFVLNDRFYKGEVLFRDFTSAADIQLINIQDARSVRVTNSAFSRIQELDILRTDFCYADSRVVDCDDKGQLFPSSWFSAMILRNPWFIVFLVVLIVLLLVAVFCCIWFRHWKKKKELELLGYPASTISRSTPPPQTVLQPGVVVPPGGTSAPASRLGSVPPNVMTVDQASKEYYKDYKEFPATTSSSRREQHYFDDHHHRSTRGAKERY